MKKVLGLFIAAVLVCAGITACGKDTTDAKVSADYLDDVKGQYSEYVDASETMNVDSAQYEAVILFHTDKNVEDFRVFSLGLGIDENGSVGYIPTEVYCSAELRKDAPIAVPLNFPGDMSLNGFSYKESDDNLKTYTIGISGKDGSLVINAENFTMPEETSDPEDSSAIDSAPTTESTSDTEKSFFGIWEFEGYVDECNEYTWQGEFQNCDYDGDGKTDKLSRSWNEDKELATYTIEFGNGDKLITPEGYETGFPHVQAGDLDGDGVKEILVTLTYDTSTDPYSFGEMWLFDYDKATGEYVEVELPLVKIEKGAKGFNVDYDKPEDNKIKFTLREAGLSRTEEVDADYLSNWWSDDLTMQQRPVFFAEILNKGDSGSVLRCYVEPLHRWGPMMGFNLNYINGKYEIGYIEIDTPHSWE